MSMWKSCPEKPIVSSMRKLACAPFCLVYFDPKLLKMLLQNLRKSAGEEAVKDGFVLSLIGFSFLENEVLKHVEMSWPFSLKGWNGNAFLKEDWTVDDIGSCDAFGPLAGGVRRASETAEGSVEPHGGAAQSAGACLGHGRAG